MNRYATVIAAALLAGCAGMTPNQMTETGVRVTRELARAPAQAAACIERNVENLSPVYRATSRPLDADAGFEVIIRNVDTGTSGVVRLTPAATGSRADIWTSAHPFTNNERYSDSFVKGC
jgi:PBP1b-binding outer membrane lipoprotein LpoB